MRVLFETEHVRVEHDPARHLLIIRRTAVRIPDDGGTVVLEKLRLALLGVDRSHTSLLVDMRAPTIRNDDTMDRVVSAFQEIVRGFRKSAVLVRTATGMLQINRTSREGNSDARGFSDEQEALAFLLA